MTLIPGTTFSDTCSPDLTKVDFLRSFLHRVYCITNEEIENYGSVDNFFMDAAKEFKEYLKEEELHVKLRENSVHLVIGALSLFYASGGTEEQLYTIGQNELNEWGRSLKNG